MMIAMPTSLASSAVFYPVIVERAAEGYAVFFPGLPGCLVRLNITIEEGLVAAIDRATRNRSGFLAARRGLR